MIRHITEWFKEIVEFWMLIGILTVMLLVFSAAKQFGFTANQKISTMNQELNALSYEKYDGINILGAEVINAINRYQEKLPVTIDTGKSVDTYQGNFKSSNNTKSSVHYIQPLQIYTGSLFKNTENEIVGLIFKKGK